VHTVLAAARPARGGSSAERPRRHVRVIEHRRRAAAVAAERVCYAPHIELFFAERGHARARTLDGPGCCKSAQQHRCGAPT
jgi:hypothetical protein